MSSLPRALKKDIDLIESEFGPVELFTETPGVVIVTMILRGVDVRAAIDVARFPAHPPTVQTNGSWDHPTLQRDGAVKGLTCLSPWNRTYGLAHVIRELNARFLEEPPVRRGST